MRILEVLKTPRYALISVVSAVIFFAIHVYAHVLGIVQNLDIWFAELPPLNLALLLIFTGLFGITLSYQAYLLKQPKVCKVDGKSVGTSSVATILGFFVAQCPACLSFTSLLLPLGAATFLLQYNMILSLISIALLLFTLNYLRAFKE